MRLFFLWVGVVLSLQPSFASETDTGPFKVSMPEKAIDVELTGKSPREFFAKRMDNPDCRLKLVKARQVYDTAKDGLALAKTQSAAALELERLEKRIISAREVWVGYFNECGPCTTREPAPIIESGDTDEAWYASYGSCQLSEKDPVKLKAFFERWRDTLLHQKQYVNKNGGYYHIIDLLLGDPDTGVAFSEDFDAITTSPVEGVLAVRGPMLFGLAVGFSYYTKQIFETTQTPDGFRTFAMQGWPVKAIPSGLHYPPIVDVLASGRKVKLAQRKLSRVLSQWYATDDGYVSYYTAGDFRQELTAVQKQARIIMQDTIANMVERVEGNPQ